MKVKGNKCQVLVQPFLKPVHTYIQLPETGYKHFSALPTTTGECLRFISVHMCFVLKICTHCLTPVHKVCTCTQCFAINKP